MESLWQHQAEAADALRAGHHVVLSTGTASGKTLGYLLPVMAATYGGAEAAVGPAGTGPDEATLRGSLMRPRRPHTALYLAPTKALAHDQLRMCSEFDLETWRVATLDGDTERADRDWAREYASYVLTNPDMLHRSVLPQHTRWASFLQSLRYVVIDESHRYRGVFGAHVSAVIRRLRRLAAHYGAQPRFVLASATSANPGEAAAALVGVDESEVVVVDRDSSARGAVEMLLWEPEGMPDDDAAMLLARMVDSGRQTIAFISSRKMAELVAVRAQDQLGVPGRIDSYRSGYLAEDRRALEHALQQGTLCGVAATNALELGVDIAGMDAVVISGFPGTRAAFWQQAGRAGRKGRDAQVILISRKQPLDAYLFDHPELLFSTPVEATVLHPDNPYVLGPHLAAAAQEAPLTPSDVAYFGDTMPSLIARLVEQSVLRRRQLGWFWTRPERAVDGIDLRSAGGSSIEIIDIETGRLIGHIDPAAADSTLHPGATYLHQGETYLSEELDLEAGEALVRAARPGYYTQPRVVAGVSIVSERRSRRLGLGRIHLGTVDVTSQVTGYLRRDEVTGDVWDETPLQLAERTLRTDAVWWTLAPGVLASTLNPAQLAGGAHGAEHTSIGLLPMYAPCDRWDIGGLSTAEHADTGLLTVFVHDGQAGGAGFAKRGFEVAEDWLAATLERCESCTCEEGCPACVVSPKCGNANQMLDKQAAIVLLRHLCS
ncbi:MAG: DEAD/DEAH box helicase [Propionibacteriaceae bacterium]|nr:DEAD/DEAH box helicase [Propionibacteriaceae bacterium]